MSECDEDEKVGGRIWQYFLRSAGNLAISNLGYTSTPPLSLLGMIDHDEAVAENFLQAAKASFVALENLEKTALTDAKCAEYVRDLVVPSMTWVREMLVHLSEEEFQTVPKQVKDALLSFAASLKTALLNENLNGVLRRRGRKNGSEKMSLPVA